jgi:replicative DNA helicase
MSNPQQQQERRQRYTSQGANNFPSTMGKLPPQAVDLEEAVLGAIMLERDALQAISDILTPEIFYKDAHQKICKAIQTLQSKSEPVDIMTVTAALRASGELEMIGGAYYMTELTNRVASGANVEYHTRIIIQKHIQREIIRINTDVISEAYEDTSDPLELLTRTGVFADQLLNRVSKKKEISNRDLFHETFNGILETEFSDSHVTGVPSGFVEIDRCTGGWQKSDLIILAARPGMGKTSFALQALVTAATKFQIPVGVFSLEMSAKQLMKKEISIVTGVPLWKIIKNQLDTEDIARINSYTQQLELAPIQWDDTPALNVIEFRAKARRMKQQHDIQLIVIDYLQLMKANSDNKNSNREQEIGTISRTLKAVAKELDIPVIALSQLSRKVEERPGASKRPMLSDLRESGSIEQDADMVIFLYRDEYYKITEDANGNSTDGIAEVNIAKFRNGEPGEFALEFNKHTTGFADVSGFDTFVPASSQSFIDPPPPSGFVIKPNTDFSDEPPF